MKTDPLFTIITVVLNAEDTLQRSIDSLAKQSFKNYEYIVVDGGSTDASLSILEKNNALIDQLIHQSGSGVADAFNIGIKNAKGKLVGFLNADDWFDDNTLHIAAEEFNKTKNENCIYCGATMFHNVNDTSFVAKSNPAILVKETSVHHSSTFIPKQVFDQIGLFDTSYVYAMDYELFIRAHFKNIEFRNIDAVLSNRSLDGISYKNYADAIKETKRARVDYISTIQNNMIYFTALLKESMAQFVRKQKVLSGLYNSYWNYRNKKS